MSNAKAPTPPPETETEAAPCGMCRATGRVSRFFGQKDCPRCCGTGTVMRIRLSHLPPPPPKKRESVDVNLRLDASGLYYQRLARIERITKERDLYRDLLKRIALEYPAVAGPNDCPPAPHGCPKCEIYFLLNEFSESEAER